MAEGGIVGEVFGGEGEAREDAALAGPDPVALAVAMDAARYDPELASRAADYLAKQGRLVDRQLHHFDEERRLAIQSARRKRFSDRIRNGLLTGAALVVLGVAGALAFETWDALHDHDLVVESFSTPPDLAARGLAGSVLAAEVRDRLNALQAETRSLSEGERASNERDNPIKMEIPETGVSLGEIGQWLRERFGRETRVSGELYHVADASGAPALALTVRAGDEPGEQAIQPEAALDKLLQSGAEAIYAATAPFRFHEWLVQHQRLPEARALLERLAARGPLPQRARAEFYLAQLPFASSGQDALAHAREAVRLDPLNPDNLSLLSGVEVRQGHTEASYQALRAALKLPLPSTYGRAGREIRRDQLRHNFDALIGDYDGAIRSAEESTATQLADPQEWSRQSALAGDHADLHDLAPAERFVREGYTHLDKVSSGTEALREQRYANAKSVLDQSRNDWASVMADAARIQATDAGRTNTGRAVDVMQAEARAHLGRRAEADALIAATPLDCYPCLRGRGRIAALEGDRAAADRWFAEALRQGPDLAFAETEWGDVLLAEGRLDEAAAKYASAHAKSPRYADALKGWGDVLARQGKRSEALAKYDEALKLAPAWRELRQARGALAGKS